MHITFIADVPNTEIPSAGPLYTAGYCCDVAETFAQEMIRKGVAVAGSGAVAPKPHAHETSTEPEAPKIRRTKQWR